MPRKSHLVVPTTLPPEEIDEEDEGVASEFETDDDEQDSDAELQKAFEKGTIKPGLNALLPFKRTIVVNNVKGLGAKLEEIEDDLPWIERLDMLNKPLESSDLTVKYGDLSIKMNREGVVAGEEKEDPVQHDFKREMLFYRQAQSAVLEGIPRLKKMGLRTKRPEDYFAQMLKTDNHMKRVQEHLNEKKAAIERSHKAKKMREMKKMGKQIQQQVLQQRTQEKRDMLNKVKDYRKGKDVNLDEVIGDSSKKKKGKVNQDKKKWAEKKKKFKQSQYGYGGKKRGMKRNDAQSFAADFLGKKKKKGGPGGSKGPRGPGKKGKKNRPGKARRQKMRSNN